MIVEEKAITKHFNAYFINDILLKVLAKRSFPGTDVIV